MVILIVIATELGISWNKTYIVGVNNKNVDFQGVEFRGIETADELRAVFPLMRQLREQLAEANFHALFRSAQVESGYTLVGAFVDDQCQGLMGYRILTDFVHGRHLYVDDLVVNENCRSNGLGARLLVRDKEIAKQSGCERPRLCTGLQNERGKGFYEREWLVATSAGVQVADRQLNEPY